LQLNQRGYNYLDERLVFKQLDQIVYDRDDQDLVLIDQLSCIKSLISRRIFTLNDKQVQMVHFKFKNFSDFRKAYFQLLAQKHADERLAAKYELLSPSDKLFNVDPKNSVRGPQTAQKEPAHMYKAIAQNYGTQ
jgi:hypothetical protein